MQLQYDLRHLEGHRIYASRKVAEKIEKQTRYAAVLYNMDVRQDQRYLAEKDLFPCRDIDEAGFSTDFQVPLSIPGMEVAVDPNLPREISCIQVLNERKQRFEGQEKVVLADLINQSSPPGPGEVRENERSVPSICCLLKLK